MKRNGFFIFVLVVASMGATVDEAIAQSAPKLYTRALERERGLRDGSTTPTLKQLRAVVAAYRRIVRQYPSSAYSDNALWQAANLSILAHERFGETADLTNGLRLLAQLRTEYPSSSLVSRAAEIVREHESAPPPVVPASLPPSLPVARTPSAGSSASASPMIRQLKRSELPDGIRITIELDNEVSFYSERIDNPRRVFFDLKGARPSSSLRASALKFDDTIVREVRLGQHPGATRVVMDLEGTESYSVFTLYDPFRLIVDFKRSAAASVRSTPPVASSSTRPPVPETLSITTPPPAVPTPPKPSPALRTDSPAAAESAPSAVRNGASVVPPAVPSANSDGKFSLSRQLGLGISRIVIDAGHGGHDPGAGAHGVSEADLTLDVALRLQKLLEQLPGVEVVMTRSTDVFIPLEDRTRIANRESADLFLSIHANASRNPKARGIETYFLNFAKTPDAEAVAARENAGSGQSMHKLPEIVRAITLNNKINESRDFADMVQRAMVRRLSGRNKQVRDIGVKQAPFVVLIGASMPSVLAEISFVTNKQEATLLKTGSYRQSIAEALLDGIVRYQQSLKRVKTASTLGSSVDR